MPKTPYERPTWLPALTEQEQREHDVAADIAEDPNRATKRAMLVYRCAKRGDLMAAVLRREGRLYIAYRQHAIPESLTADPESQAIMPPPASGMDHMRCCELPDNWLAWWPDWSMNCGHSAYRLTREQLAADIERFRGERRPVVSIQGNVFYYDHQDENDRVDTRKVR